MLKAIDDNKNLIKIYDNSEIDENIALAVSNRVKDDLTNVNNDVFKAKVIESGYQSLHVGDYLSSAEDIHAIDPDFVRLDGSLIKKTDYPYLYDRFTGFGTKPVATYTCEPLDISLLTSMGVEKFSYSSAFNFNSLVFNPSKTRAAAPIKLTVNNSTGDYIALFDTANWRVIDIAAISTIISNDKQTFMISTSFRECSELSPFIFLDDTTIAYCIRERLTNGYENTIYKTPDFFVTNSLVTKMYRKGSTYFHDEFMGFGETSEGVQFVISAHTYNGNSSYDRGLCWLCWNKGDIANAKGSYQNFGEYYFYLFKLNTAWFFAYGEYPYSDSTTKYIRTIKSMRILKIAVTGITFTSMTFPTEVASLSDGDKATAFLRGVTNYKGKYIFGNGSSSYITSDLKNYEAFSMGSFPAYYMRQIVDLDITDYPGCDAIFINQRACGVNSFSLYTTYTTDSNQNSIVWSTSQSYSLSSFGGTDCYSMVTWIEDGKLKIIAGSTKAAELKLITVNFVDFNNYFNLPSFSDTMSSFKDSTYVKRSFDGKNYLFIKAR